MRRIHRIISVLSLPVIILSLSGCGSYSTSSTEENDASGELASIATSPYGEALGYNPENPYPVISEINNSLSIEIDYYKEANKASKRETYYGIGRGFISSAKIAEGEESCIKNRLKKLSDSACAGKYSYKKLLLASQSPSYTDIFEKEAYILEENFRGEKLVLDGKDSFDVILMANTTQTEKLAKGGKIFDIFINSKNISALDEANISRGTATGTNSNGNVVTVGRSLREILEDCGQNTVSPATPTMVGVVQQGPGTSEEDIIALNKKYSDSATVPGQLTIESLASKVDDIKKLNNDENKKKQIDKFLADDIFKRVWYLVGTSSSAPNHPSGGAYSQAETTIDLGSLIDELRNKVGSSYQISITLDYAEGGTSYFVLTTEKDGNKNYYTYRPALYSAAVITSDSSGSDAGMGIGKVDVSQEEDDAIYSDPWCGFTPECKPAIYLYPEKTSLVKVTIGPSVGQRTITIPPYNSDGGWRVLASPSGAIYWGSMSYTHLFYEAMTEYPKTPTQGWIIDGSNVADDLYRIGNEMGLNNSESEELGRYWSNKLKQSPYYFVGLIDQSEIEKLEPLSIQPQPDTTIRMRFYFKALSEPTLVENPQAKTISRKGFTVVEWGGYVE